MSDMTDVLGGLLNLTGNLLDSDLLNRFMMAIFAVILVFGVLNCILGYRLLRFWMMLGGFFVGAGLAFVIVHGMGVEQKSTWLVAMIVTGVIFAVVAFLIYKAGVFILAAGIGWALSIYFLHPTSSAVFFACILIGIALGSMAVKYCREVLIIATSLIGGLMAGISLAKLGNLADIPYGLGMGVGFAVLGTLIQFAINKPQMEAEIDEDDEEETADEKEDEDDESVYDREPRRSRRMESGSVESEPVKKTLNRPQQNRSQQNKPQQNKPRKSARPETQRTVSKVQVSDRKNGRKI